MGQEQAINDILEIVSAIKDSMVTREEFDSRSISMESRMDRMVTRDEFHELLFETRSEIMSHVDSFMHLHNKLDTELTALRGSTIGSKDL
ncbi:MAG: hypothetical protein NUV84_01970 [Candidatus Uhrbacteria bacterium]|nr:hypothetical protein [Candidatus Uhrbacteria bacterium]